MTGNTGNNNHSKDFMEFMAKKLRWQERRIADQVATEKRITGLTERTQEAKKTAEKYKDMVGEMNVGSLTAALRYLKNAAHDLYLNVMQSKPAQNVANLTKRSESVKPRPLPKDEDPNVDIQNKKLLAAQEKAESNAVEKIYQKFKAAVQKIFAETTAAEKGLDEIQLQKAKAAEVQLQIERKQTEAKGADLKVQEGIQKVLDVESEKKASTTPGAPKLELDATSKRLLNGDISQKDYADEKSMGRSELKSAGKIYDQLMAMVSSASNQLEKLMRDVALIFTANNISADDLEKQNQKSNNQKESPELENNNPLNNLMKAMSNASTIKNDGLDLMELLKKLLDFIMQLAQGVSQNVKNAQAASDDLAQIQAQAQSQSQSSRDDMRPRPSSGAKDDDQDDSQYQQNQNNNQSSSNSSTSSTSSSTSSTSTSSNNAQSSSPDDTSNNSSSSNTANTSSGNSSGSSNTGNDSDSPDQTTGVNSSDSSISSSSSSYTDPETSASPGMSGVNATLQTAGEQFDGSMKEFSGSTKEGLTTANTSFSPQTGEKGGQIDFSAMQNASSMQSPSSTPKPSPGGGGGGGGGGAS